MQTNLYWSRSPGKYLNPFTGTRILTKDPFIGNVQDWYLTLTELILTTAKMQGLASGDRVFVSRDIMVILQHTLLLRPEQVRSKCSCPTCSCSLWSEDKGTLIVGDMKLSVEYSSDVPGNVIVVGKADILVQDLNII